MSYKLTLEKAGAKVLDFESFGSYQGTWLAYVEFNNQKGIVRGYFGSCSYCDAFQSEFESDCNTPFFNEEDSKYYSNEWEDEEITKEEYDKFKIDLENKLKQFGLRYLGDILDLEYWELKLKTLPEDDDCFGNEKEEIEWAIKKLKQND